MGKRSIIAFLGYWSAAALLAPSDSAVAAETNAASAQGASGYYRVINGKVDAGTFRGWQVFHSACYGCHGVGAVGSEVAPDLTARIKRLSPTEFAMTVLSRYRVLRSIREGISPDDPELAKEMESRQRGPRGVISMPAWESDQRVKPHILDLYAYLRARADAAIGPGRPVSFESSKGFEPEAKH